MVDTTIAVVPRDRFSKTGHTLRRLLEVTPRPFRLVVVDPGAPPRYRAEMERAVAGVRNVEFLRSQEHLNASAAKNWVLRQVADGEFLALVENDILVAPGWLDRLIRACEEDGADVARPMIYERKLLRTFPHFDERWDRIETVETPEGKRIRFHPRDRPLADDAGSRRRRTQVLETHCLLFRRTVFEKIEPFDERITTRLEVDLALRLHAADIPIVFEPAARVTYLIPPPVNRDERDYFLAHWSYEAAVEAHEIIAQRWGVVDLPSSLDFVRNRPHYMSRSRHVWHAIGVRARRWLGTSPAEARAA